MNYDGQHETS